MSFYGYGIEILQILVGTAKSLILQAYRTTHTTGKYSILYKLNNGKRTIQMDGTERVQSMRVLFSFVKP
jgi:hypothetical protein